MADLDVATADSSASVHTADISGFPASRLSNARDALSDAHRRIVRSAAKAGQEAPAAPQITVTREGWRSRCTECKCESDGVRGGRCGNPGCDGVMICRPVVDLTIAWSPLRLAGWEFLAVVEPLVGGNLIRQVPGAIVAQGELATWRTAELGCDHCQTDRRRSETFVVRADGSDPAIAAGTHKCVGRSCLAAFLGGQSPAALLSAIGWRDLVIKAGGDGDGGGGMWSGESHLESIEFLSWVAAIIRIDGWTSKANARTLERKSTSDVAVYLLTPPFGEREKITWRKDRETYQPNESDAARGAAALAWSRALSGASDYELNLQLVASQSALDQKHAGILASAVMAHSRHLGQQTKRESGAAVQSQYVGTIGARQDFGRVTLERVASFDTEYGRMHVHTFRDAIGNALVWKTGHRIGDEGSIVEMLVGTVKRHAEFRGEKQTELARCTLLDAVALAKHLAPKVKKPRKKSVKAAHDLSIDTTPDNVKHIDICDRDLVREDYGYSSEYSEER
jgi:hypothetical protein